MSPKAKARPAGVPEAAFWSESDNEWIVQTVDERGRKHGLVRYFRPDGTLCCETEFEADQPHGAFTRYHETGEVSRKGTFARGVQIGLDTTYPASARTTERGFPPNVSSKIHHYEQEWKDGVLVRRRFVDAKGRHIFPDGTPYPPRPKGVPEGALYEPSGWELGAVDRQGTKLGTWITYDGDGAVRYEDDYEGGCIARRTRVAQSEDDARVAFERGAWQSGEWVGPVSQLDAERKELRTFDPTGADAVDDPKLAAWAKRVRAIDWSKLESAYGPATLVGVYLVTLGCSKEGAPRALDKLTNATCHQGSIYSASARVIEPLLELVWLGPDVLRQQLLALVHAIAALPAPAFAQAKKHKSSDAMACVKALDEGSLRIVRGFASLSEPEAVEAITCLAGCFGNQKVAALLRTLASDRKGSVRLRAAAITALGNLSIADKKLDADVKPALRDDDVAIRVAAVMGRALGHHRPAKLEVDIMLAALAHADADAMRETFAALPFVEDSMEVELAQLLAVAGRLSQKAKTQLVDALLATLAAHRGLGALPVALAGLDLLFNPDDDERDHGDDGPPTPEARTFVQALVDKDDLWMSGGKRKKLVDLANALEERDLPTDREGLRAWAK